MDDLIIEIKIYRIRSIYNQDLNRNNFSYIITVIIGLLVVIAGIFSIPQIKTKHPSFLAIKSILTIIAIAIKKIGIWLHAHFKYPKKQVIV